MYFITPSDPNIFLIGVDETKIYGIGEKNEKLCIYQRLMFDIGNWRKLCMINVKPVKCDRCKNGIHVAANVFNFVITKKRRFEKKSIWIAARENQYTRVFSINIGRKKRRRYKMLEEIYPEFALLDLNLCCKCVAPTIFGQDPVPNFITFLITPQNYQKQVGIYRIFMTINKSGHCLLWKKNDSFKLADLASSNILNSAKGRVLSINEKSEDENGRIKIISFKFDNEEFSNYVPDDGNFLWHEMSFRSDEGFCLTRRRDGDKSILRIYYSTYSLMDIRLDFNILKSCTVDANFPSLESTHFYVSYQSINDMLKSNAFFFSESMFSDIISFIVFQTADGKSIVTIPCRPLSLSESAYLSLARIPGPPQISSSLPIANISFFDYLFQCIRNLFYPNESKKEEKVQKDVWMSINFIKKSIGWPRILPLTKAPNLSN